MRSPSVPFVCLSAIILPICTTLAQPWTPPPIPDVPPVISGPYDNDLDGDSVDDLLQSAAHEAQSAYRNAGTLAQKRKIQARLEETVDVKLIFSEPVTQGQIDTFLALGGRITFMYPALRYGWNGDISLDQIPDLPAVMGPTLVLVDRPLATEKHLHSATRTGRVRPIWRSGFADNLAGFDGDPSITIAIIDSGIDAGHPDFAGRRVYWWDFSRSSSGQYPNPVDYNGHGSHVAGIALGSGAVSGLGGNTSYSYVSIGDASQVSTGGHIITPIHLPSGDVEWDSTVTWLGGGQAGLYHVEHALGDTWWYDCSPGATGTSSLSIHSSFEAAANMLYATWFEKSGPIREYAIQNTLTDPPGTGDGYNKLRGVAPACKWAVAKDEDDDGNGWTNWSTAALADLSGKRRDLRVKVATISSGARTDEGLPAENLSYREEVVTAVQNGIVVVTSAGNDGWKDTPEARAMADPARTALAITVGAANNENALTWYSTFGFSSPDFSLLEDYKPDVIAPGGSDAHEHTLMISVDSDLARDGAFSDQQPNDYAAKKGTSMASPFVAGCAALVIDAMQQKGISWDFYSDRHPRYVKMILCATATETNADREAIDQFHPTLQRAERGPMGFPAGKDPYEGYGIINPDAAVEAVYLDYEWGTEETATFGSAPQDRRAWARGVELEAGTTYALTLDIKSNSADFDLYLYSATPDAKGTPVILASSTSDTLGADEEFSYPAGADMGAIIVVKRVSGSGSFTVHPTQTPVGDLKATNPSPTSGSNFVVDLTPMLKWTPGATAREQIVYMSDFHGEHFTLDRVTTLSGDATSYWPDTEVYDSDRGQWVAFTDMDFDEDTLCYWRVDEVDVSGHVHEGDVWTFRAIHGKCYEPTPEDGGTLRLDGSDRFEWKIPHVSYSSYDFRIMDGPDYQFSRWLFDDRSNSPATYHEVPTDIGLIPGETYYWTVEPYAKDDNGQWIRGRAWSFTVVGNLKAHDPSPSNGWFVFGDEVTLRWTAGDTAVQHDFYHGWDPNNLSYYGRITGTQFLLYGLSPYSGRTYYWRVDEVEGDGTVHRGDVWRFVIW